MDDVKNYRIALDNVPNSERIIFKLICSVSTRTKGRSKHYELVTDKFETDADILIRYTKDNVAFDRETPDYLIEPCNSVSNRNESSAVSLSRPLIATRVLTALDSFADRTLKSEQDDDLSTTQYKYTDFEDFNEKKIEEDDGEDTINLMISEEEARELAIVHDETLTNPSNKDNDYLKEIQSAQIRSIASARSEYYEEDRNPSEIPKSAELLKQENDNEEQPRALVVDDSPSVRKQLEIELDLFNVNVDYAATAKEAMTLLDTDIYDVAFLDVVLPDGDGFSICRHIKETGMDTSVIMLTGKAKHADKVKGALAGCDAYLVKPVGRMTFQTTVRDYLSLNESASAVEA